MNKDAEVQSDHTTEGVVDQQGDYRLYNPNSYIPLSIVFSFLLPGVLFAINQGKLYGKKTRNLLLALFIGSLIALFTVAVLVDGMQGSVGRIGFLGVNVSVAALLMTLQGPAYRKWKASGVRPRRLIFPILISLVPVCAIATLMILLSI
jgi:hypothetical protein